MRGIRWIVGAGLALLLLWLFVPVRAQTVTSRRAGLVVVHGDGRAVTRCVSFSEESLSGLDLLQRSGLAPSFSSGPLGSTLCSLHGEGCPETDCFCECKGSPCAYWTYFHRAPDGSWTYAGLGAAARWVGDGDVDGWVWGDGATAPPVLSFDAICPSETASETTSEVASEGPAAVQAPSATATAAPTATHVPTLTPSPASTATPSPTHLAATVTTPTAAPTVTATSTASPTPRPAPTSASTIVVTAAPAETPPGRSLVGYGAFGLLVLGLGGLFLWQRKR